MIFSRTREPLAPLSVRVRRNLGWIALALVALGMVSVGLWVAVASVEQSTVLAYAKRQLANGELETARATLDRLGRRRLLPAPVRRQVAAQYFRLGDDVAAHNVLKGLKVRPGEAEDRELREWSNRCLRASQNLKKADEARDPKVRVELLREAVRALPDAPALLQRLAQEELLASTRSSDPAYIEAFERHYMELRQKAPDLAQQLKRKVAETLAQDGGVTER